MCLETRLKLMVGLEGLAKQYANIKFQITVAANDEIDVGHQIVVEHGRVALPHAGLGRLPVWVAGVHGRMVMAVLTG